MKIEAPIFRWNEQFETGIAIIDEQHQTLVRLLNRLASTLTQDHDSDSLNRLLQELTDYAALHFRTEEEIWQQHFDGDQWHREHRQSHQDFVRKIAEMRQAKATAPIEVMVGDMLKFLTHWLAQHMLDSDQRMARVVHAIENGADLANAKTLAMTELSGATHVLIDTVLEMYDHLNSRTVALLEERSEHLKTAAALDRAERREHTFNDAMLAMAPEIIYLVDAQLKLKRWSHSATTITGYSDEALADKSIFDFFDPADHTKLRNAIERLFATGSEEVEIDLLTQSGEHIPCLFRSNLIELDGQPHFAGIVTDLTSRKAREALLLRRERQLRVLAEAGREIHEHLDEQAIARKLVLAAKKLVDCQSGAVGFYHHGKVCFREYRMNHQWLPIELDFPTGYGVPGHVLATKTPYISNGAANDAHVIAEIQQQLQFQKLIDVPILDSEGELLGCFEMHDRADGADFDAQDLEMLQSLACIVAAALINARQQAQMQLLDNAIAAIKESIIITDARGVIIYVNPSFTHNTGFSRDEAIGQTPAILNSKQQSKAFYKHFWRRLRKGEGWSGRILDRKKDGTIFPVYLSVSPVFNEHDEITHYIGVHEDMSENEEFQKQLVQSQKMEAIGTLVGGVAHDFNNLMAGIVGNLYMIRRAHADDVQTVERIKGLEASIDRGAQMIHQMLAFARHGTTKMQALNLVSFIKEASKLTSASLPESTEFRLNIDRNNEIWIRGNSAELQQIILNLLANAQHAVRDRSEPQITLTLAPTELDAHVLARFPDADTTQQWCRLSCKDNGYGIAPEHLERIFDPFFTTKKVGEGTGLGMAMVYNAVQNHKGMILVESELDRGTEVNIYLPMHNAQETFNAPNQFTVMDGHGLNVLVVDDEARIRDVMKDVLTSANFRVLLAEDGAEAVALFEKQRDAIDLIIMDVVMPKMGGVVAAEKIRDISATVPIIFQTGYGEQTQLAAMDSVPNSHSLQKPVKIETLIQTITQCFFE